MTRQVCTKDAPRPPNDKGYWVHPDAKSIGEASGALHGGGDTDIYYCPHCGLRFRVQIPD
jgi:hypothetical protein